MSRENSFAGLQAGRAVAAFLVLMYHASRIIFAKEEYWGFDPLGGLFAFGQAGVEFFFVLSGFIMAHVHGRDLNVPSRFLPYLKKRFCRIYPVYWIVLAAASLVYVLFPSTGQGYEREAGTILSSFALVHINAGRTVLSVGWTLYHEVLFYLAFGLLIWNKRLGMALMGLWMAGSAVMLGWPQALPYDEFARSPLDYFFSPLHLLFALGMATCEVVRRAKIRRPFLWACAGIAVFFGTGMQENYGRFLTSNAESLLYGLGSAMALAGLLTLEKKGKISVPSFLRFLGDASYSIYLTHLLLLSAMAKVVFAFGAQDVLPPILFCLLLSGLALAGGALFHVVVERPLLRRLRRAVV